MRMHLELIRRHYLNQPAPAEITARLEDVEAATQRLEHLLAQLLILARAEEQVTESQLLLGRLNLVEIVAELVAERVPQAVARGLDVQFEGGAGEVSVVAHPVLGPVIN